MQENSSDFRLFYETPEPNCLIDLGSVEIELPFADSVYRGSGETRLQLLPRPRVIIEGDVTGLPFSSFQGLIGKPFPLKVFSGHRTIDLEVVPLNLSPGQDSLYMKVVPTHQPLTVIPASGSIIRRIDFHVLNFKEFFSSNAGVNRIIPVGEGWITAGLVDLKGSRWSIQVTGHRNTRVLTQQLKEAGGYAITHVGRIEKEDGDCFTGEEAEEVMELLHSFLSFSTGAWSSPLFPQGLDEEGKVVWEQWGVGICEPWITAISWFDTMHSEMLTQVFTGFADLWYNEIWRGPLYQIVEWYLRSNLSTLHLKSAIVMTHTALDTLAWTCLVEDRDLLTPEAFKRLSAADRLRLLLGFLDIPPGIPEELTKFQAAAMEYNWIDGSEGISVIRNEIVHPDHKQRGRFFDARSECWNLGQWYIELILLRLCGHTGCYANRITQKWTGGVTEVPWGD